MLEIGFVEENKLDSIWKKNEMHRRVKKRQPRCVFQFYSIHCKLSTIKAALQNTEVQTKKRMNDVQWSLKTNKKIFI